MRTPEGEERLEGMDLDGGDVNRPRDLEVDSFRQRFESRARGAVDGMDLKGLS